MRRLCLTAVVLSAVMLVTMTTGCTTRLGDFTVLSTKNVNLANFNTQAAENACPVVGEDSKIIIIIPGAPPNLEEAVDDALESSNSYALTNAAIYYKFWWVPYIVGEQKFEVKGHPIKR